LQLPLLKCRYVTSDVSDTVAGSIFRVE
jgi:hypothetical protein